MALFKTKKEKTKKKKKLWIVVVVIALILAAGSCGGEADSEEKPAENKTVESTNNTIEEVSSVQEEVAESVAEEEPVVEAEPVEEEKDNLTLGQRNALESAKSYLSFSGFSYSGFISSNDYWDYFSDSITCFCVEVCTELRH